MSRPADNFRVDITSWFKHDLQTAVELIDRDGHNIVAWDVKDGMLFLLWHDNGSKDHGTARYVEGERQDWVLQPKQLLSPLAGNALVELIWSWLHDQEYPDEPNIDGSCSRGFRIQTWESDCSYVHIVVEPEWLMHHK